LNISDLEQILNEAHRNVFESHNNQQENDATGYQQEYDDLVRFLASGEKLLVD